jgi:hypothetical protein
MFQPLEVLRTLNADALTPEQFNSVRKGQETETTSVPQLMKDLSADRPVWGVPSSPVERARAKGARLRQLVDEWIETGFSSDGGDAPQRRELIRTREAVVAVRACAATNPCQLHFLEKTAELVVVVGVPAASLFNSGRNLIDRWSGTRDAIADADRIFTSMMTSGWKYEVCKCRHCGRYFIPPKLRRTYRHGTFCSRQHQRLSSAAACTNQRRTRVRDALLDFAATWVLKRAQNPLWQDDKTLKRSLAAALSAEIARKPDLQANRQGIRINWVTWNAAQIEKRRLELVTLR